VYCFTLGGTFSESPAGQMQGALAQEGQAPFQASATPQMAGRRLARREPPESAMTALQRWTREQPLPAHCALSWHFRGALKVPPRVKQYTSVGGHVPVPNLRVGQPLRR